MYRHFRDNMYFAWSDDQLIGLDLEKDSYTVFSTAQSDAISLLLKPVSTCPPTATPVVNPLLGGRPLLKEEFFSHPDFKIQSRAEVHTGVSINCWRLSPGELSFRNARLLMGSLMTLRTVHRHSRISRLLGLIKFLDRVQNMCKIRARSSLDIDELVPSLNAACMLYPQRTKCLEWACALIALGARHGFDMKLVIGVQNRPFFAHAWVEFEGKVIGDDPNRRRHLAVIYETRRLP